MKIKIPTGEIVELLKGETTSFPKYSTQLINLANQNSQGTRARVVGQMSDLIQEFEGSTVVEWKEWYVDKHPDAIENATDKIFSMVENFKEAVETIDRELVRSWVEDLVIYKTFSGLRFQEAILKKAAQEWDMSYRLATPEEESRGIDGYLDSRPVSIKPVTYKIKLGLNENIEEPIIFYEKKKDGLTVEFNPDSIR